MTVLPAVHVPERHVSLESQALPSLHEVPSATVGLLQTPVAGLHVPATWHWSDAVHVTLPAAVQRPAWQVSLRSQAFPSLHAVPLAIVGFVHWPVLGLHVPATWHWSDAVHVTVLPAMQAPAWHVSFESHAFPSLHAVPLASAGFEHCPVLGLHVPAPWHWSDAVHVTVLPAVHVPDWHVSFESHAFPSLQEVPFATLV